MVIDRLKPFGKVIRWALPREATSPMVVRDTGRDYWNRQDRHKDTVALLNRLLVYPATVSNTDGRGAGQAGSDFGAHLWAPALPIQFKGSSPKSVIAVEVL